MNSLLEDANKLLKAWSDYYAGNGSSAGLNERTRSMILRLELEQQRWVPTPDEEARMVRNGEF